MSDNDKKIMIDYEISFPSHKKDWKKFESNNKRIDFIVLHVPNNSKEIRHA